MNRRLFLAAVTTFAAASIAGCKESGSPPSRPPTKATVMSPHVHDELVVPDGEVHIVSTTEIETYRRASVNGALVVDGTLEITG